VCVSVCVCVCVWEREREREREKGYQGSAVFDFFCSLPERCSPWNRSFDFSCSKPGRMEKLINWRFCFYKCLLPHLPCGKRAPALLSLSWGHLEGSKSVGGTHPLWGRGSPSKVAALQDFRPQHGAAQQALPLAASREQSGSLPSGRRLQQFCKCVATQSSSFVTHNFCFDVRSQST